MAHRKLDMGLAWTQATALMGANRDTISAIAGLFFFLPTMASTLLVPELANPPQASAPAGADPQLVMQAMMDAMAAVYAENWPLLIAVLAVQFIGSMSLFALLTDRGNPTVGEALRTGIRSLPSYLAAQLLTVIGASLAIGIPLGVLSAFGGPAVGLLAGLIALGLIVWVMLKLVLVGPVIAIEAQFNPLAAMARSWQLTKGNTLRIFIFVVLLAIVIGIIFGLISAVVTLVFSAIGGSVATIGIAVVDAAVSSLMAVIFLTVTVTIYRQLAAATPERVADIFE